MSKRSELIWAVLLLLVLVALSIIMEFYAPRPAIYSAVKTPTPAQHYFQLPTAKP